MNYVADNDDRAATLTPDRKKTLDLYQWQNYLGPSGALFDVRRKAMIIVDHSIGLVVNG